jgi:hypothetical protein
VAFAAVGVIVALTPFALRYIHRQELPIFARLLAWTTILWIVLLPLRLTQYGQETANRSAEFTFLGVAVALGVYLNHRCGRAQRARLLGVLAVSVIFAGGIAISFNFAERMAPNLAAAGAAASPTPDDDASAKWLLDNFGPHHIVASDLVTGLALGSIGQQNVVFGNSSATHTYHLFFDRTLSPSAYAEIRQAHIQFVVVQSKLIGARPLGGAVFDVAEPPADSAKPVPLASLEKFRRAPGFTPIYTSGEITIYEVSKSLAGE